VPVGVDHHPDRLVAQGLDRRPDLRTEGGELIVDDEESFGPGAHPDVAALADQHRDRAPRGDHLDLGLAEVAVLGQRGGRGEDRQRNHPSVRSHASSLGSSPAPEATPDLTRWQRKRKPAQTGGAALERNAQGGTEMKLQGRVALVTGGGGGLGRAMAEAFASEGAAVAVADVDRAAGESVAQGIRSRGGKAMALHVDVAREEQVDGGVAETVKSLGRLDVAVSNAGVQHIAPLTELKLEDWRR